MRNLGRELRVEAMSLYRYFPSKAALEEAVADLLLAQIEVPDDDRGLRHNLATMSRSCWRLLVAHPNVVPLLLGSPLNRTGSHALAERFLRMTGRAGLDPAEAHRIFRVSQALIFGTALMLRASPSAAEIRQQYEELERAGTYPLLRAALAEAGRFEPGADFEFGTALLLDAVDASVRKIAAKRCRARGQ
jgi:AcrR family transcriptional regulator